MVQFTGEEEGSPPGSVRIQLHHLGKISNIPGGYVSFHDSIQLSRMLKCIIGDCKFGVCVDSCPRVASFTQPSLGQGHPFDGGGWAVWIYGVCTSFAYFILCSSPTPPPRPVTSISESPDLRPWLFLSFQLPRGHGARP